MNNVIDIPTIPIIGTGNFGPRLPLVQILCDNSPNFAIELKRILTATQHSYSKYEIGGKTVSLEIHASDTSDQRKKTGRKYHDFSIDVSMDKYDDLTLHVDYEDGLVSEFASFSSEQGRDFSDFQDKAYAVHGKPIGDLLASDGIYAALGTETCEIVHDYDNINVIWVNDADLDAMF